MGHKQNPPAPFGGAELNLSSTRPVLSAPRAAPVRYWPTCYIHFTPSGVKRVSLRISIHCVFNGAGQRAAFSVSSQSALDQEWILLGFIKSDQGKASA